LPPAFPDLFLLELSMSRPTLPSASATRLIRSCFAAATLLLASACGGQATDSLAHGAAAATAAQSTSTTYALVSIDGQTTSPFFTCTSAGSTEAVTGASIVLASNGSFTATVNETVTQNGVSTPETYQAKGRYTQSGNVITLRYPGGTVVTATLSGGTLTISGYPYCGGTHDLVFQRQ
jgi:hypothetical protein